MKLSDQACEVCRVGAPLLTQSELEKLLPEIPDWSVNEVDSIQRLTRRFSFDNFKQAQHFTNLIGDLAEDNGHHPALLLEWGRVTVSWWTHKIKGLHRTDAIMAAKTDAAYLAF